VWSARDHTLVRTLAGHEGRILGLDAVSAGMEAGGAGGPGSVTLASVSYDRTLKLWAPEIATADALISAAGSRAAANGGASRMEE
jgi:U4/U6 small nuclear ribonucleoprotein PRP4